MLNKRRFITLTAVMSTCLVLIGCQPGIGPGVRQPVCEGKASIEEAVRLLSLRRQNSQPLRGRADCVFYYKDDKGEEKPKEVSSVTVLFVPPVQILFKGDIFGEEVGFGANEDECWVRIKPEFDSYWWGTRKQTANCTETLLINPYNVIEALGTVEVTTDWQLSYQNGYDILTLTDFDGTLVKRFYVDACDYLVNRIEYFDQEGFLKASADLSDYTTGELVVPQLIKVTHYQLGIPEGSVEIQLRNIRSFTPETKHQELFERPERDGFEHMYRLNEECEFVEEQGP